MNRKAINEKPILIFGIFSVFKYILKLRKIKAAMIENAIKNYFYPIPMALPDQLSKVFFGTEVGVNLKVIFCVIFVIGRSLENRI